jgi:hypothetical protein
MIRRTEECHEKSAKVADNQAKIRTRKFRITSLEL